MEYNRDNLLDVVRTFFKWKKPIIITCLAVGVITAAVSLLLPNYYEASTTFYAASPSLQSPSVIFGESSKDLEFYGEGEDMDRLIQAAESNELFRFMAKKFDLYKHYDIDSTHVKARFKLRTAFNSHFSIIKNERDAIVLSIEDKDKALSAQMANAARNKINEIGTGLIRGSQEEIIKSYEKQISNKELALKTIADSLAVLRELHGIFDATTQKETLGELLPNLQSSIASEKARLEIYIKKNRRDSINKIKDRLVGFEERLKALTTGKDGANISMGLSKIEKLSTVEIVIMEELGDDKSNYEKYKSAVAVAKPALFIQDVAEEPVVKSRPKRSLIVIGATFMAFLFSLLGVLVLEYNKDVDWKGIVNAK